jgi:NADPH2:quinone reductase
MKAIRCREWGAPGVLRLDEAESPSLEPHQVRIRVRAAGVNFADSLMVGGTYQVKPPFPFTPGLEAAGEIVETGSAATACRPDSGCSRCCATVAATPRKSCSMPPQ